MRRLATILMSGVAGLVLLVTAAVASSGVTNGSFEANGPAVDDWWWHALGGFNGNAIHGWTVPAGKSVDLVAEGTRGWQASDGIHSVDLDGDWPGAIEQTLTTVPGAFYVVRFDMSGNPDPDTGYPTGWSAVKQMRVSASGSTPRHFSYDIVAKGNTHANMKYEAQTFAFQASGTSTTLAFTSLSAGNIWWGPVIDNVRVSEFTKDSCKSGGWQTLVDKTGRSFKNQGDCVSFVATRGKNGGARQ